MGMYICRYISLSLFNNRQQKLKKDKEKNKDSYIQNFFRKKDKEIMIEIEMQWRKKGRESLITERCSGLRKTERV